MAIYCCSDLHGYYSLYEQMNASLQPEDKVIFLGDACDRGPKPWETVCAILDNPQWFYLMGNHESMLITALKFWTKNHETPHSCLSFLNGGELTFEQATADLNIVGRVQQLENLPRLYTYKRPDGKKVICTHAGFSPYKRITPDNSTTDLWDRYHIWDEWDGKEMDSSLYVVHGHTPQSYITHEETKPNALFYCGNHKIDLDTGCFVTGFAVLFNLDTFEEKVFYDRSK